MSSSTATSLLRPLLDQRVRELERDILRKQGVATAAGAEVRDRKDEASLGSAAEVDEAEVERDLAELRDATAALARMDAGLYGECVACGQAIPMERLKAQPTALRCLACQQEREPRQARHG